MINVTYKSENKIFQTEELLPMVLLKIKETVESFLGKTKKDEVVTLPELFNHSHKKGTKDTEEIL